VKLSRNDRAMKTPKAKVGTKQITIRISQGLHDEIAATAAEREWTINAEINYRLRTNPVLAELEDVKRMLKALMEMK